MPVVAAAVSCLDAQVFRVVGTGGQDIPQIVVGAIKRLIERSLERRAQQMMTAISFLLLKLGNLGRQVVLILLLKQLLLLLQLELELILVKNDLGLLYRVTHVGRSRFGAGDIWQTLDGRVERTASLYILRVLDEVAIYLGAIGDEVGEDIVVVDGR